jgi:hypothetical protein
MSDREERMRKRLNNKNDDTDDTDDTDGTDVTDGNDLNDGTDVTDGNDETDGPAQTVRETAGRTFYLGEETLAEIDELYKQLEFRYYQQYGEELPKNRAFYPALFEVLVEHPEMVAEKLGVELE